MKLFNVQNWSVDLHWKVLFFNVIQNSSCSLWFPVAFPSSSLTWASVCLLSVTGSLGFLIRIWEPAVSNLFANLCLYELMPSHLRWWKALYLSHDSEKKKARDPKNSLHLSTGQPSGSSVNTCEPVNHGCLQFQRLEGQTEHQLLDKMNFFISK